MFGTVGKDDSFTISLTDDGGVFREQLDTDPTGLRVAWSPDLGGTVHTASEVGEARLFSPRESR